MKKFGLLFFLLLFHTSSYAINMNFDTAFDFYKKSSYKEAYTIFFHLQQKKHDSKNCFYLGNISHFLKRDDEAENWYIKGMQNDDDLISDNHYFNLAVLLIKKNDYKNAISNLNKIDDKSPFVRIIMAILHYNEANYEKAEVQIKKLIKEVPAIPEEFLLSVYENYFYSSLKQNKIYQAISIGHLLINYPDSSGNFKADYGGILFNTGQISKSIKIFETLVETQQDRKVDHYFKLLFVLIQKKDYKKAIKYMQDALKLYSKNKKIMKIRAYVFYMLNEYVNSWSAMKIVIPKTKDDYKMKAIIAYKAGKNKEAIELLETAFLIYPKEDILINLLSMYIKNKNYKKTELLIRFYQKKNKTDKYSLWLFQLAIVQKEYDRASLLGEKILRSSQEQPYYFYYNLGKVYEKKGVPEKSIELYEITKNISPDFPHPYVALGNIFVNIGEYEKGIDNYIIGIKFLPEYSVYYYQLAQAYALSEKYFLAHEAIKQAINKGFSKNAIIDDPLFVKVIEKFPELKIELTK